MKNFFCTFSALLALLLFYSSAFAQGFFCPNTPRAIAAGDFNGDNKLDIALVRQGSQSVFIYPGDGQGGLGAPNAGSPSPPQLSSVAAADFVPGGNFEVAAAITTPTLVGTLSALAVGHFDGDGKLDVAVADTDPASGAGRVRVFLQNSFPNFALSFIDPSVLWGPADIAVGDFNGNGKPDVAVAKRLNSAFRAAPGEIAIFLGNGAGGFTRQPDIHSGGSGPQSIVAGDFNGDGKFDLAVLHFNSTDISILLGEGNGNFAVSPYSPIPLPAGIEVPPFLPTGASLLALDFNSDGKLDLMAATHGGHGSNNRVFVLLGDGEGGFTTSLEFDPGFPPRSIVAGDFNGDGLPDIAASFFCGTEVKILLNPLPLPGKAMVYVSVIKEDKVAVIDPETDTVIENIAVDEKPDGITILPSGTKVYVVNERKHPPGKGGIITVIKTSIPPGTHTILTAIPIGKKPRGIAATPVMVDPGDGDGARFFVYVAEKGKRSVGVIDSNTDALISRVPLDENGFSSHKKKGKHEDDDDDDDDEDDDKDDDHDVSRPPGREPIDIAFSPDGRFAYVLAKASSALVVLDTTKAVTDPMNAVLNRLRLGRSPEVVAADPLGQFVYVGHHGDGELLILDASGAPALTEVAVLDVGRKPKGIAIQSDGSPIYVNNHESDDVTVISRNGSTHTILDPSVPVERKPLGIGILPEGTKVYVANERSGTVSVIETAGDSVTGAISVGDGPRRIAVGRVPN